MDKSGGSTNHPAAADAILCAANPMPATTMTGSRTKPRRMRSFRVRRSGAVTKEDQPGKTTDSGGLGSMPTPCLPAEIGQSAPRPGPKISLAYPPAIILYFGKNCGSIVPGNAIFRPMGECWLVIEKVKDDVAELLEPSTQFLVKKRFRPDVLTLVGFIPETWLRRCFSDSITCGGQA